MTTRGRPSLGSRWRYRVSRAFQSLYAPWDDFWYQTPGSNSGIEGIRVTPETAMTLSAVWACVGLLEEGLSCLSLPLYKRLPNGGKERAVDHPLYWVIGWQPNLWQTTPEFEALAMNHCLMRGNFYAEILEDRQGYPTQLIPLNPDLVNPSILPTGEMSYEYRQPGNHRTIKMQSMHHRRGRTLDGIRGVSAISYATRTLGIAMAGGDYAANFFKSSGAPPYVVEHPQTLGEAGMANLRTSVRKQRQGEALILEEGAIAHGLGISPKDAQLLEAREFDIEEIARIFNVPLHLLKVTKAGAVSYASVEMFDIDYVVHTLRPWAVRFEKAMWRDLLSTREQGTYVPEYNMDALLRGDASARVALYKSGVYTINEARERENLNPRPDGDRYPDAETEREPELPGSRDPRGRPRADRATLIVQEAASRVVQKEIAAVTKAAKRFAADAPGWQAWLQTFYTEHAGFVADVLKIDPPEAERYAVSQRMAVSRHGVKALDSWESEMPPHLAALALGEDTTSCLSSTVTLAL
jgi:HK97 family phage portal protein